LQRNAPPDKIPDVILPVPLSAQRLAERGFNQAVELARPLARRLNIRLELGAVRRVRDTAPQARLPWKARTKNIRHAFECDVDLTGKTIWVVDDVMTTGATLNELARVPSCTAHGG
jgi:ComF family protein